MTTKKRVLILAGTRPEVVKMAPVVRIFKAEPDMETVLCVSGQHREMLLQTLDAFDIEPDMDLAVMQKDQTLAGLTSRLFEKMDELLRSRFDLILVQGDTTTVMVAALAAFYRGVPVGHIEAGLRSHNIFAPFPEEVNRRIAGLVSTLHFAPTEKARENLLKEGVPAEKIFVTGNTVIDALLWMREKVRQNPPELKQLIDGFLRQGRRYILVTGHRRENFGSGFENLCLALLEIVNRHQDVFVVYPVHLNPQVQKPVHGILGKHERIVLLPPVDYREFVYLLDNSYLVITDSGGVQEEAPSLGKPVLVTREVTERPEGVASGNACLVGTDFERINFWADKLLLNKTEYERMSRAANPYGDGHAARRIFRVVKQYLGLRG
jgi:UDP-N-acetylglucosamine 2-epimerase